MQEVQRFNKVLKSFGPFWGILFLLNPAFYGDLICFWVPVSGVFIVVLSFRV